MFLIFIKTCLLKYYKKIQDTFFYVLIFNLINKLSCQFEFLLRMLISNNICYVNVPSCDVLLGSWPSDNHNNLKTQEILKILDR